MVLLFGLKKYVIRARVTVFHLRVQCIGFFLITGTGNASDCVRPALYLVLLDERYYSFRRGLTQTVVVIEWKK